MSALCLGFCVSGCSNLIELPGQGPAPHVFDLMVQSDALERRSEPAGWRVHIAVPDAPHALDTDRVIVRKSEVELQFYKDARWSDRAPQLVQTLLVDALDDTGAAEIVSGNVSIARSRYVVKGYLRNFEAQYNSNSSDPQIVVRLKLFIVDQVTGDILRVRSFDSEAAASSDSMNVIARTMNGAMGDIVSEAVPWIITVLDEAHEKIEAARRVG